MTLNKETVVKCLDGFDKEDHEQILSCVTDDVEWVMPGAFHHIGKKAFGNEIKAASHMGKPQITTTRLIEEDGVVLAEGLVRTTQTDGKVLQLAFCDVFEMAGSKIKRLTTYLVEIKNDAP